VFALNGTIGWESSLRESAFPTRLLVASIAIRLRGPWIVRAIDTIRIEIGDRVGKRDADVPDRRGTTRVILRNLRVRINLLSGTRRR